MGEAKHTTKKGSHRATDRSGLSTGVSLGTALLAGAAVCYLGMEDSWAQSTESPDDPVTTLPSVVVTGESRSYFEDSVSGAKFTTPVSRTPKTIQIIDQELIEDQQATTLTEALKNTPGVGAFSMGETGSSSTGDAVYMRGVDASGSIFVDGVRDAGSISRDLFNIEQVEVVKGADGSMYGRTSLNGTINMVTKQANLRDSANVDLSVGTHEQKRGTLDINRKLSDTSAFRLNVVGQDSQVPGRDKVRHNLWGIAPAIAFGLGTDTRLFADYLHLEQRNQPDGGVMTLGLPGYHADPDHPEFADAPAPDSSNYYGTSSDFDNVQKDQLTLRLEKDFSDRLMFHNTMRWAQTHQNYMLSSFTSDWDPSWDMNDFSDWQASRVLNTKDQTNSIFTNQAGFVQRLATGPLDHTLSYGLEFSYERLKTNNREAVPGADQFPINIYYPSYEGGYESVKNGTGASGKTTTIAGYIFDTVELGDRWQFNAGLRLDRYWAQYDSTEASARLDAIDSNTQDTLFSWQLGALYKINEYGNVYAQYAVAQQPPGNDGLVLSGKAKYADRPEYDPQRSKTAEIGTKWKLADERVLLSAALFQTDIDNQVEFDEVSNDYVQSGKKRIRGLDLAATGRITPRWDISLGYTRLDAKVTEGENVAMDGSSALNYTPKDAFSSWTTYRLTDDLTIGGGARYVGKMQRDAKGTPATPEYIDSYWVVDAMVKYALNDHMDLQLNGYNLTDENYVAAINKKGHRYIPGLDRSAILSLKVKF